MDRSERKWEEHRKAGLLPGSSGETASARPGEERIDSREIHCIRVSIFVAKDISFAFLLLSGSHFC